MRATHPVSINLEVDANKAFENNNGKENENKNNKRIPCQ
jgi:hypothetical protein